MPRPINAFLPKAHRAVLEPDLGAKLEEFGVSESVIPGLVDAELLTLNHFAELNDMMVRGQHKHAHFKLAEDSSPALIVLTP